jgi:N-methylhydantoinase B
MDGVDLAVISSRLNATVHGMMNTIFRSGRSGVLNSAHDFSCCIVSANHELVMGAESLPVHMMRGPDLISRAITSVHPVMRRGDAFLHNSPYNGNSHAADHCMFVPVVDPAGKQRFSVLAKAHQADCGNSIPTTYMPDAQDVYAEGALLFDAFRAQEDYADNADLIRLCRLRIRVPDQWWGDYLALLGAVRVGERRMLELGEELGWDVLDEFVSEWFQYSEQLMGDAIATLPSGSVTAVTYHDPIAGAPDGLKITVTVDVRADDRFIEVDLRDNADCLPNGLNLTESTSTSAAMIGIFNSIGANVPPNAGSYRRIDVLVRENCVVGIPVHPASCSTATSGLADRVANAVGMAFAELADGVGLAECGLVIPASAAVISGRDPRSGDEPFVNQFFLAQTGGAGTAWGDGWLTHFHVGCAGMLRRDSIEIAEMRHPLRVREQRLLADTEGAGRNRGAPSAYVEYGPLGTVLTAAYGCDGALNPALGVRGGLPGGPSRHLKRDRTGRTTELPAIALAHLEDGETIISVTCGGGGYGSPAERDPRLVREDVIEGWISRDRAAQVYRVAVTDDLELDEDGTAALRAATPQPSAATLASPPREERPATVIKSDEVEKLDRGAGITSLPLVTRASDPSAAITTGVSTYPTGTGAPLHSHDCDEQVTLLEGVGEVEVDGVVTPLARYDSTYIPAGRTHAFRNTGAAQMTILWIYPTQHVTRTLAATGETVEHLSDEDTLGSLDHGPR